MKFKVLLLFISTMMIAFVYCRPAFASWVMLPQDDGQCPQGFEIFATDTDYGEINVCVPEEISPSQDERIAQDPSPASRPHNGVPLEGPHFDGAM